MLVGVIRPALAAEEDANQAQLHLRRAAAASDLGNYADAAKEYEAAYMKNPDGNLLTLVGQAWQQAGDRQKALTAFRSCVRLAPDGEQRTLCDAKVRELEYQPSIAPATGPAMPGQAPMGMMPLATPPPPPPAPVYVAPRAPAPAFATCPPCARAPVQPNPAPFLIVLGALVVVGVVVGVLYAGRDDLDMPITTYGAKDF